VIIDLALARDETGPARLLDVIPGRSGRCLSWTRLGQGQGDDGQAHHCTALHCTAL